MNTWKSFFVGCVSGIILYFLSDFYLQIVHPGIAFPDSLSIRFIFILAIVVVVILGRFIAKKRNR